MHCIIKAVLCAVLVLVLAGEDHHVQPVPIHVSIDPVTVLEKHIPVSDWYDTNSDGQVRASLHLI